MAQLSVDAKAFIRPSPSSGTLGGVRPHHPRNHTPVRQASGFDVTVETVRASGNRGRGRAGWSISSFSSCCAGGERDELQGIKKGVMELADMIAITKADSGDENAARRAAADYSSALKISKRRAPPGSPVLTLSAREGRGFDELWANIKAPGRRSKPRANSRPNAASRMCAGCMR